MNIQEQNFLILLEGAVNEIRGKNTEGSALTDPDWGSIFTLANRSNLLPLIFQYAAGHELCAEGETIGKYSSHAIKQIKNQASATYEFLQLYKKFNEADIHPVVMKGIICRQLYGEHADERPSGDEDVLIRKVDFPAVRQVLEANGYTCELEEVSDIHFEQKQEISFFGNGLHIEVHLNALGKDNDLRAALSAYVDNDKICSNAIETSIECMDGEMVPVLTMCPTDHLIYLVLHAWRHFTAGGIGIRQMLDILMYAEKYSAQINQTQFDAMLSTTGTENFYKDIQTIGGKYLGFDALSADSDDLRAEKLLTDALECGSFGNDSQELRTAESYTRAAIVNGRKENNIWRTVFPPIRQLYGMFPKLVKYPWLLPWYWLVRIFRFLRHNKENGGNLAQQSLAISRKRLELLSEYGVVK